ncbi:MAG TPA: hypothetical protein VKF61_07425 [Candidatus Polarisedimenticolia bacterium]|nr:hypothetical protein [Candidatus Polarisedimenticolia bacterium]
MRPSLRAGWIPWCAAVLLALLAVSMLHAAAPHGGAQRDCQACKALSSPGVAHDPGRPGLPAPEPAGFTQLPPPTPLSNSSSLLKPLRAPPESSVL